VPEDITLNLGEAAPVPPCPIPGSFFFAFCAAVKFWLLTKKNSFGFLRSFMGQYRHQQGGHLVGFLERHVGKQQGAHIAFYCSFFKSNVFLSSTYTFLQVRTLRAWPTATSMKRFAFFCYKRSNNTSISGKLIFVPICLPGPAIEIENSGHSSRLYTKNEWLERHDAPGFFPLSILSPFSFYVRVC